MKKGGRKATAFLQTRMMSDLFSRNPVGVRIESSLMNNNAAGAIALIDRACAVDHERIAACAVVRLRACAKAVTCCHVAVDNVTA